MHNRECKFARSTSGLPLCGESAHPDQLHLLIGNQELGDILHLFIIADLYQAAVHLPEQYYEFANKSAPCIAASKATPPEQRRWLRRLVACTGSTRA